LTVIKTPEGIDSNKIVKNAYSRYNLSIGIGLSQVCLFVSPCCCQAGAAHLAAAACACDTVCTALCSDWPVSRFTDPLLVLLLAGADTTLCAPCLRVCSCAQVNGKVFRIGHLGNMDELMMCSAISGAEMAMLDAGGCCETRGQTVGCVRRMCVCCCVLELTGE
jgi:hypothetical protein